MAATLRKGLYVIAATWLSSCLVYWIIAITRISDNIHAECTRLAFSEAKRHTKLTFRPRTLTSAIAEVNIFIFYLRPAPAKVAPLAWKMPFFLSQFSKNNIKYLRNIQI